MNLTATTHSLELVTGSTAPTDWVVDFVDIDKSSATAVLPGSAQGTLSSAADTTIVSAPGASVYRTVKHIAVRNKDASATQTVTIQKDVSGTEYEIAKATLAAGESWEWTPEVGSRILDAQGRVLFVERATANVTNAMNVVVLASDVTNNNAVANTIADVTGLSFNVTAGETYWFEFVIPYTAAATTTGSRWSINGPASPTMLAYRSEYTLTATTTTVNSATAHDTPAASNASSLTTGNVATIWGVVTPSSSGTITARFASEVANSAIIAKAGATLRWMRVL